MSQVHERLKRWILVDGFHLVVDLEQSQGTRLVDQHTGRTFLDMFSCFASMPVGWNHPDLVAMQAELGHLAINNVTNSDVYSDAMADAVESICSRSMPAHLERAFFVAGGALAVENTMKVAMDRKQQQRQHLGLPGSDAFPQVSIAHYEDAFHGRTGYTMSLTNTDPVKTDRFAKFEWPRLPHPTRRFPDSPAEQARLDEAEATSLDALRAAADADPNGIAGVVIEPIQGEGGDNHVRDSFLRDLQRTCEEIDALFIVDEVQTGVGATGRMWAYEHADCEPDLVAFGKKMQVCGLYAGKRSIELEDNPLATSSRINSTWGGNLIDMVRGAVQLEIMEREDLLSNAERVGAMLNRGLADLCNRYEVISNPRGRGLMSAFTLPDGSSRDRFRQLCHDEGVLVFNSGEDSIRMRPSLTLSVEDANEALEIFERATKSLTAEQVA